MNISDIASSLKLHRSNRSWRGACPVCGYSNAFVLDEKNGRPLGWCSSCENTTAVREVISQAAGGTLTLSDRSSDEAQIATAADKLRRMLLLLEERGALKGTPGEAYLIWRGLPNLAKSAALGFHASCPHLSGVRSPAIIAAVSNVAGETVAIHRTYVRPDGAGKAALDPPKASLCPMRGGAIRLDPAAAEIVIGEGIETAASAGILLGLPAWASVSSGNLKKWLLLPREVRSVVIAADPEKTGEEAAQRAAQRFAASGRRVRIARTGQAGKDFNDLIMEGALAR